MTEDLQKIYSRAWYEHDYAELGADFALMTSAIDRMFERTSVLDVGCGPGLMLEGLYRLGWRSLSGIEGSSHAVDYASARGVEPAVVSAIEVDDIRTREQTPPHARFGLVISTEVAEHIEPEHAEKYVALLASSTHGAILFTAAPPGQGGNHHVNCQPLDYWADLFAHHGVIFDLDMTEQIKARWSKLKSLGFYAKNVAVFR